MNWKKEIKSWGLMLSVFAFLYFTGLMTPIMGGVQSVLLSTGLIKPKITLTNKETQNFDYRGKFTDMQGKEVFLEDYKGKTVFINLWATWCPPCRAEMPHIESLYGKVKDNENIEFLMIALDKEAKKSKDFIDQKEFTFPVVHAGFGLNNSLQSESIPTTLVVSPEGKIVFYQEGMSNFDTKEFMDFLTGEF
ncbi:thiol-disulfide oxidoreductase [Rhodonellum psychrophilum GCM71 = DSM 17998]|uniref:Thiol-disulfide oxidoreductase n=2 Tax=Rhodonellum TaxID=336827 RepID=U5BZ30_9BACT|nr:MULTISPECIES: TlpA disulfide reductase family protein [Rhodonellum]ERM81172.1 thiol-disulfide oxidoreductase [Rhodonellum psychrophilum GCM71 = DSM 17998]MDO9554210.1 TlpA disulfide reductase family protein [Rhodonellum sp.]SDZ20850.1 Thiol-disulfide isomerase or thioredoxin [Rhodonellum ikkaensis]